MFDNLTIHRKKIPRAFGEFGKNFSIFFHILKKRRVVIPGSVWYNIDIHTKSLLLNSGILHRFLSWSLGSPLGITELFVKGRLPASCGIGGFCYLCGAGAGESCCAK